jgi:hypothetical protein
MLFTFCNDYVFCKLHSIGMLKRKNKEPMLVTACEHLIVFAFIRKVARRE